jgi:hypothetical protein
MPESPALLSEERLSEILARLIWPASYTDPCATADVEALLADRHHWQHELLASQHARNQLRQAVAEQLRGLLVSDSVLKAMEAIERAHAKVRNNHVHRAAHALQIDLLP